MRGQCAETLKSSFGGFRRIVWMHTNGGQYERIFRGQPDPSFQIRWPAAGANGEHTFHLGGAGAPDHRRAVFIELSVVQVTVRIDQPHLRRAPTGTSSWNPTSTGLPPSTDAATIIPFDSMPRSFRGCKLATITTLRFS